MDYPLSINSNPCSNCGGTGVTEFIENGAPMGEGFWGMPMAEPCPACLDQGVCPSCGTMNDDDWVESNEPCPMCGWRPEGRV